MKKFVSEFAVIFMVALLLTGCAGMKRSGGGPGEPGLVQVFSKGKDSLLCHAGPVRFEPVKNNDRLSFDYTYLKVKGHSNPVTCNFSLISRDDKFRPATVVVDIDGSKTTVNSLTKFFAEGYGKKDYIYRYSFEIPDSVFYNWMKCEKPVITVNDRVFEGGSSFRKDAKTIYRKILFDLYD